MKTYFTLFLLIGLAFSQSNNWQTYYEESGFLETPHYAETIEYCKRLAQASPQIEYQTFGISPQGRELPLLIVNKDGLFSPEEVRKTDQVVFYIQAGIHSGEIDGKDAGFMLLRDIVIHNKYPGLLDHVTILFNPILSVDAHERFSAYNRANQNGPKEMGWRVTAQNLNLNRDYLKADAPEMQAMLRLYNEWLPEFFADCHVTDGADYQYAITYKIDLHGIIDENLVKWTKNRFLASLKPSMQNSGFPIIEYVYFRKAHDLESGMGTWAAPPRFSDGYMAIQNRPGLLIETHMFKDYKTRVDATYQILKHTLSILNREYKSLRAEIKKADEYTASSFFRSRPYTLTYKHSNDSTMINFLGFEYNKIKSDLTGGDWYRFDSSKPKTFRIPFFNKMDPDIKIKLPDAYIIPVEWQEVIQRLDIHGIQYTALKSDMDIEVDSYSFRDAKWSEAPFEGRHTVSFKLENTNGQRTFPAGSVLVPMNQRAAKVIANILEPQAMDSFVYWGFFNAIFERKEYVESYVMEEYARMMLASNPGLEKEFRYKMEHDSSFAANPQDILMWFYQHSPYWDTKMNQYPIGKIYDTSTARQLLPGPIYPGKKFHQMTNAEIGAMLQQTAGSGLSISEKINLFSEYFLGTDYNLTCTGDGPYALLEAWPLVNFEETNCMAFCEHVLALSISDSWDNFFNNLQQIRYKDGIIGMKTRNHYTMADWLPENSWLLDDVSAKVGGEFTKQVTRTISHTNFFKGKGMTDMSGVLKDRTLTIDYVPLDALASIKDNTKPGDILALLFANLDNIFSAHMLMIVEKDGQKFIRESSNSKMTTFDTPYDEWVQSKQGLNNRYIGLAFMRVKESINTKGKIINPADIPLLK